MNTTTYQFHSKKDFFDFCYQLEKEAGANILQNKTLFWEKVEVSVEEKEEKKEGQNEFYNATFLITGSRTKKLFEKIHFSIVKNEFQKEFDFSPFLASLLKIFYDGCLTKQEEVTAFFENFSNKSKPTAFTICYPMIVIGEEERRIDESLEVLLQKWFKGKSFEITYDNGVSKQTYIYVNEGETLSVKVSDLIPYILKPMQYSVHVRKLSLLKDAFYLKTVHPRQFISKGNQ